MKLLVPIMLNCVFVTLFYMLDKKTGFRKFNFISKQILIGVVFGSLSAFASPSTEQDASAIPAMVTELDKLRRQLDRVQDLFEQDVYSLDDYRSRHSKLDARMQELKASISAEKKRLAQRPKYATHKELVPAILRLFDAYETATPQQKNDMLKTCISSVIYRKSKQGTVIKGHVYSDPNAFELDIYPVLKKE